jgi:hypothetical protein
MSLSMSSLLLHSERIPAAAREVLRAAHAGASEHRIEMLESAARILEREVGLPCTDARELMDLQPAEC